MKKSFILLLFALVLVAPSMNAQNVSDTTGNSNNVSLGPGALQYDSLGQRNTAIGASAMFSNTSGSYNTSCGNASLLYNLTGSKNVALGLYAGSANISGDMNTFLGANSNAGGYALSNATAIGYASIVSQSNSLVLGGTGLYTVNVGIGVPAPHAQLHLRNTAIGKKIILFEDANNDHQYYGFAVESSTLRYQANGAHAFFISNNATSSTEAMRIMNNGNIGIGTASPREKLDINGVVTITNGNYGGVGNNAKVPVPAGGAGTIIFSNGHFLGWNGTQWKQLDN